MHGRLGLLELLARNQPAEQGKVFEHGAFGGHDQSGPLSRNKQRRANGSSGSDDSAKPSVLLSPAPSTMRYFSEIRALLGVPLLTQFTTCEILLSRRNGHFGKCDFVACTRFVQAPGCYLVRQA